MKKAPETGALES